jgi:3-carboxy-cis,cis-muconate cycloisomerase
VTFDGIFVPRDLREAVSDRAWLEGMLEAERALARAEARAGVIPEAAAAAIAAACQAHAFDPERLAEAGRATGNPAEPLVRALREAVGGEAAGLVHRGATSQDIVDTAAMLVARRALALVLDRLDAVAAGCARLAEAHRSTPMAARTLLQQAVPTTFGLKAAGWLVAVLDARRRLAALRDGGLAAQLGGAAGTLAALGDAGLEVARLFAAELDLPEPELPWHTNRVRIAELGSALAVTAGVLAKIGLDVALLEQTEVGEVSEPAGAGGSSAMPHKRNPVGSAIAGACARRVQAAAGLLAAGIVQEHERAAGAWQAEWGALSEALACTGGAAAAIDDVLDGLDVNPLRMRANLDANLEAVMSEQRSLDPAGGREQALDPESYLGSAATFVDRALDRHRRERKERR